MENFILSKRSKRKLECVTPEIVAVVFLALKMSRVDFAVIDGARSIDRQKVLFLMGRSKTEKSLHLLQDDGYTHAVDLIPCGFDTFDDITDEAWEEVNIAMKKASEVLNYPIHNGFDMWGWDRPHWQDRK